MAQPRILFILSQNLGWSTYSRHLEEIAQEMSGFTPIFHRYRTPPLLRFLSKKDYSDSLPTRIELMDPISAAAITLSSWWKKTGVALRPDAIHVVTNTLGAAFARLAPEIPLTVSIDGTRIASARSFRQTQYSPRDIAREKAIFEHANHVFALTTWAANSVHADYGIPLERITRQRPPIGPLPRFKAWETAGPGLPKICFIGNDFRRKGGGELVHWHQTHFRERAELHILSKKAPPLNLRNVVRHAPMPNERVVSEFLPSMDLMCFPTRQEMAGFVVAEAACAGLPVIAYEVGGLADMIRNGETGYLIREGDEATFVESMERLISNQALRREMGEKARRFALETFDRRRHFEEMVAEILAGISRTAR